MSIFTLAVEAFPQLVQGVIATLRLMVLSFLLAIVLALPIALARMSRSHVLKVAAHTYVEVVRGMPSLTLLFLIYFGLPSFGVTLSAVDAAIFGLGLNGAAYVSEIYRAGIQAIDDGQREAAQMVGLRRWQVMRYVVLPQALRIVIPPLANFSISLLKDTSVASLISAPEMMLQARDLTSEYFMPLQIYTIIGVMYLLMALPLSFLARQLARHLSVRSPEETVYSNGKV
ncbi:His/Glu/Gln/Arg/opine family amino acid ABC transporter permease subunit [Neorhizobium galegae]|uniref:amino acid ABC transporter permease n=1 Tax=Neorhizobium galegae TaxID=399 RepID=UPI002789B0BC|nr:amino acid ABC transporter permease [Neorhizobium galegae]MDQ0138078.1 His/Glu/Gln/Arg/opine family amino acid ABC transporter permease subunit [Neorhizobium galegae]